MKRLLRTTIALLLVCVFASEAFAAEFTDIAESYWGAKAIYAAAEAGIILGVPMADGTFRFEPERDVSQQEADVMVGRTMKALGLREEEPEFENTPARVASRQWVAKMTLEEFGLNTSPVMVLRYGDYANISTDCVPAIDAMYRYGLMKGDNHGNINPQAGILRVEFATVCQRLLSYGAPGVNKLSAEGSYKERDAVSIVGAVYKSVPEKRAFLVADGSGSTIYVKFAQDAQIYLNGSLVDFDTLAKNVGSGFALGCIAGRGNTVVVTTEMKVQSGTVKEVVKYSDYTVINIDGIDYYADASTSGTVPAAGRSVRFINEGAWISEII